MRTWALIAVMLLPGLGLYSAFEWHDYLTRHERVAMYGYRQFCCVNLTGGRK